MKKKKNSYSELKGLLKSFNDSDYINLGDTLYCLVEIISQLIERITQTNSKTDREVVVRIKGIYIEKLISSNISLSLLPMV